MWHLNSIAGISHANMSVHRSCCVSGAPCQTRCPLRSSVGTEERSGLPGFKQTAAAPQTWRRESLRGGLTSLSDRIEEEEEARPEEAAAHSVKESKGLAWASGRGWAEWSKDTANRKQHRPPSGCPTCARSLLRSLHWWLASRVQAILREKLLFSVTEDAVTIPFQLH